MEKRFLVADIGGTNTTIALAIHDGNHIDIIHKQRYATRSEPSLSAAVEKFLASAKSFEIKTHFDFCCISGAGPVDSDHTIRLTNAPWIISAKELRDVLGVPVRLINDFTALSYAVTLVDYHDTKAVRALPHTDGSLPAPSRDGMMLVLGAGTGLGVGFVYRRGAESMAFPSEGGHSELPCVDGLSRALHAWLSDRYGYPPGAELAISGQGIANIFEFLTSNALIAQQYAKDYGVETIDPRSVPSLYASAILNAPREDWPARIASGASCDPWCALAMELFARLYATKAANLAALFLPESGVWLAGGISSKNEDYLLEGNRFMRWFEQNYASHIRSFLAICPVYIVRNYDISLLGAAEAAWQYSEHP